MKTCRVKGCNDTRIKARQRCSKHYQRWMKAYFTKVLANPDLYQLLCANCNVIKKIEQQEVRKGRSGIGVR